MCATQRDIVLFLGAGFSAQAGYPLMRRFGEASLRQQLKHLEDSRYNDTADVLRPAKANYETFCKWLQKNGDLSESACGDMEAVFLKLEELMSKGDSAMVLCGKESKLSEVRQSMILWLWNTMQECRPSTRGGKSLREPYSTFLRGLADAGFGPRTTIVSTNYDLLVEYLAKLNDVPVRLPLKADDGWQKLSMIEKKDNVESYLSSSSEAMLLCKIQGSISFLRSGNSFLLDDRWLHSGQHPAIFNEKEIGKLWKKHKKLIPLMLPPMHDESSRPEWLKKTWQQANCALRNAKAIIFIGYSLPPSDEHIREMIGSAIAGRKDDDELKVWVVDPDKHGEVWPRYTKLFHNCASSLQPLRKGFETALCDGKFADIFREIA